MTTAYYLPLGEIPGPPDPDADDWEYFSPTEATVSVWGADMQHGGPPSGLLTRALSRCEPDPDQQFTRITVEILGAIGLGVNRIRSRLLRPGRQISLVGAELEVRRPDGDYRVVAQAAAWRMRTGRTDEAARLPAEPLHPAPDELPRSIGVPAEAGIGTDWGSSGFVGSVETAVAPGRTGDTPAWWVRPTLDLVDGEPMTDLESVFTVLDIANGLGTRLPIDEWSWMNTDTTVHLVAPPTGPWLGIDADMAAGRHGFGATFADLYDSAGFIGRSAQTVLLRRH